MALDLQAIATAGSALLVAVGGVLTGIYTGRNTRRKEESEARERLGELQLKREQAEEEAGRLRIEQISREWNETRAKLRERDLEEEELRYDRIRGWDLARYYWGLTTTLIHLLNNIFLVFDYCAEIGPSVYERLFHAVGTARMRMKDIKIPERMEDPIPDKRKSRATEKPNT